MKNKKGFTISEVLVVLVIIGIILGISIPSIVNVRKKSNERLLESKKDIILVAAELYAKDKGWTSDGYVYVYELIKDDYVKKEVNSGVNKCTGENTSDGCIINPVNDESLNNQKILVKVMNDNYIAIWEGEQGITGDKDLIDKVKEDLDCTDEMVDNMECVYCYNNSNCDDPNNYLYYSGMMWRVMGVYRIDGKEVAKMITDDTVTWETNA